MSAAPAEQRIRKLEEENAELKHVNEILQKTLGFRTTPKKIGALQRNPFIFKKHHGKWAIKLMCTILCVSVSGYY